MFPANPSSGYIVFVIVRQPGMATTKFICIRLSGAAFLFEKLFVCKQFPIPM